MRNNSYTVLAGFALAVTLLSATAPHAAYTQDCAPTQPIARVSASLDGKWEVNWDQLGISGDGRFVAFGSAGGILIYDRQTGEATLDPALSDGINPSLSTDGRYIAFTSDATNLVPDDTNDEYDVFVYDRQFGQTIRASVASDGTEGNAGGYDLSLSGDGRFVAFESNSSNLVPNDTNETDDIFVHDLQTGETTRVSVASDGTEANAGSIYPPSISWDGRYVAFRSVATNLVSGDTNDVCSYNPGNCDDIFVHDRQTRETTRVSVASDGTEANRESKRPNISSDGRFVAFMSWADNLVSNDTNDMTDVFVHDRQTGETTLISVGFDGKIGDQSSDNPTLSRNGRYVAFLSWSRNLVAGYSAVHGDIFVRDLQMKRTWVVSLTFDGAAQDGSPHYPIISGNGAYAAFYSMAANLVPGDTNEGPDIFLAPVFPLSHSSTAAPSRNCTTSDITLTWNPITWAASYRIQVDTDTAFDNPFVNEPTDKLEKPLTGLEVGIYYWRVQAIRANSSAGGWSAVESFTVGWE